MKNYYKNDIEKGLSLPSGSLCQLLYNAEEFFRKVPLMSGSTVEKFVSFFLQNLHVEVFPSLTDIDSFETVYGIENHYTSLIHLPLKKYFALHMKKSLKEQAL